ncbi:MAG TPA: hypothetical protein VFJ58_07170, partial [Armatimonadota bacterium]|nr:hypothetical protein [Armatimonadota bacterium]
RGRGADGGRRTEDGGGRTPGGRKGSRARVPGEDSPIIGGRGACGRRNYREDQNSECGENRKNGSTGGQAAGRALAGNGCAQTPA